MWDWLSRSRMGLAEGLPAASFTLKLCRNVERREAAVSRFRKLSHTIWHCQYHITWVPNYRFRILTGPVGQSAAEGIQAICGYAGCEVVELNVQKDHVHLIVMVPPKVSISNLMGRVKGQTSMKLFKQFRYLRKKPGVPISLLIVPVGEREELLHGPDVFCYLGGHGRCS
jgi:putative transposase